MVELSFVGNKKGLIDYLDEKTEECHHVCTSNCRRNGCNCACGGEWHCEYCKGTGIVTKVEWTGDDDSHEIEMSCPCTQD